MIFIFVFFIAILSFYPSSSLGEVTWVSLQPKKTFKSKAKVWQVQVETHKNEPLIYLIQSMPAQIRIFYSHTKYHHPISLSSFGLRKITHVGLSEPLEGRGQVLYMADQATRRVLYIILGKKRIREFPLPPGAKAYNEFIARLHPASESERHF